MPSPPIEMPPSTAPPEFMPGRVPSELPDRGGSEVRFP